MDKSYNYFTPQQGIESKMFSAATRGYVVRVTIWNIETDVNELIKMKYTYMKKQPRRKNYQNSLIFILSSIM